jgi:fructokinase
VARLAGLELGGTNANLVIGDGTNIVEQVRLPVMDPDSTLTGISGQLAAWDRVAPIEALGIASFGPVGIRPGDSSYGHILKTPKPGWADIDLIGRLGKSFGGALAIHTDVTAAALAEQAWGAAQGCGDFIYMTVGTGIGMGVIAAGKPVIGQLHPEAGHIGVKRMAGDEFAGSCPFHGDCLEGLASGPAIAARAGQPGNLLNDDDRVWEPVIDALAEACATLLMTLASERIVIGGGVINQRLWLVDAIAERCAVKLGGYLPFVTDRAPVVPAALGELAGQRGALLLAQRALT